MRRQHYLQRTQAVQMINAYAEAMNGGKSSSTGSSASHRPPSSQGNKVSGGALLGMMGKRSM